MINYVYKLTLFLIFLLQLTYVTFASTDVYHVNKILTLKISSSINPATLNYLKSGFAEVKKNNYQLLLIKMNTPGGLITTTKKILTLFGESNIPIVIWVTPEGASATSAGAIIASGAHLLYMNQGTNIGAATPVNMGKDIDQKDLRSKAINDLKALVQSLSIARGRNQKDFGLMIDKAKSYKSQDAFKLKLINGLVHNEADLIQKIHNKIIKIKNHQFKLKIAHPLVTNFQMDLGQKLLNILSNPSLTYILFLIGAALIYLELQAPGGLIAGSLGAICIIMAGIGFQLLPLNFGALGLIILAFILFIIEIFVTSFGLISLLGLISLITGSLFLYRTDDAYLAVSKTVIFSSLAGIITFLGIILLLFIQAMRKNNESSFNNSIGKSAIITRELETIDDEYLYYIKISGELWKAKSNIKLHIHDHCKVIAKDKNEMILIIEK